MILFTLAALFVLHLSEAGAEQSSSRLTNALQINEVEPMRSLACLLTVDQLQIAWQHYHALCVQKRARGIEMRKTLSRRQLGAQLAGTAFAIAFAPSANAKNQYVDEEEGDKPLNDETRAEQERKDVREQRLKQEAYQERRRAKREANEAFEDFRYVEDSPEKFLAACDQATTWLKKKEKFPEILGADFANELRGEIIVSYRGLDKKQQVEVKGAFYAATDLLGLKVKAVEWKLDAEVKIAADW